MTGWQALFTKEVLRFWKVSFQTIAAPVLTACLYLLIFGHALNIGIQRHAPLFGALLALLGDAYQRRDLDAVNVLIVAVMHGAHAAGTHKCYFDHVHSPGGARSRARGS